MTEQDLDVVGIGSAIVDVIAHADDGFLEEHGMAKGTMALVESEADAEKLYAAMGPGIEMSGGSCANTLVGITSLGGTAGFVGLVRDDQLGHVFGHDIRAAGVEYHLEPQVSGPSTARCLILVTPDAQRTLNTFLGIANQLGPDHIDADLIRRAGVLYCEGYLWDLPQAKEAMVTAMEIAAEGGGKVAFTLSDPFCVDRHRSEFLALAEGPVDILFANEAEICSLYQTDDFDRALQHVRDHCEIACLTRSEKGSVIVGDGEVHVIDAHPVGQLVDTTGAGDLYASGFLYGYTHGLGLSVSGRLGSLAAGEVVSHVGARPEADLATLAADLH